MLDRVKTSIKFATDPDNPDRLFQEDSPTRCLLCFRPWNILIYLVVFLIIGTVILNGKLTSLIVNTSLTCPSFTNSTENRPVCMNMGSSIPYPACITIWLIGSCTILSLLSILVVCAVVCLLTALCLSIYEVIRAVLYNDPVIKKKDDDDGAIYFPYLLIKWQSGSVYVVKPGTSITIFILCSMIIIALIYVILIVILPVIGIGVVKITGSSSIIGCTSNTTIGTSPSMCTLTGFLVVASPIVIGFLLYPIYWCLRDTKNSIKLPDEVMPIKTRRAAELANYNTL